MPEGDGFKVADGYVDIHAEPDKESGRRAAIVVTDEAENTGRSRSRRFFAALFTPNTSVLQALRTGIPAVLSSPIGLAALTLGGLFAASFISAVVAGLSLGALGGAFIAIGAFVLRENEKIKTAFETTMKTISEGMAEAAAPLVPAFEEAFAIIGDVFTTQVQPLLLDIFTGLAPVIEPLTRAVGDAIVTFLTAISDPAVLDKLAGFFIAIAPMIPQIAESMAQFFTILADNADLIAAALQIVVDILAFLIPAAANVLVFFSGMLIALKMSWDTLWAALKTGAQSFWNFLRGIGEAISGVFHAVVRFVTERIEMIKEKVRTTRDNIVAVWTVIQEKFITPFREGVRKAVEWVQGLPGKIGAIFVGAKRWLFDKGADIIEGLISGIKSAFSSLGDVLSDAAGMIPDWFPGSPVKKGPLRIFNNIATNPGAKLAEMFHEGFERRMADFMPSPALAGIGNVTVNPAIANPPVSVHVMLDGREIAPTVYAVVDERDLQIKRAVTSGGSRLP